MINDKEIFVFGSNLAGRHGKGAALYARQHYGAEYSNGVGIQGMSYAIPTKDENLRVLGLDSIKVYVDAFIEFAKEYQQSHPDYYFLVTAIGTGLAGYKHEEIAPMFLNAPTNCHLPLEWINLIPFHREAS